jgi:ribonuclease P protein component
MVFALVWRPRAARRSLRRGVRAAASVSVREQDRHSAIVERLKRRGDFRAAAEGLRASGRAFVLQARQRAGDEAAAIRIGFTVSRQVGNAVVRNRVRRRLREIVRLSAAAEAAALRPGHDYVLIGRRAALTVPFGEMMQDLGKALIRVHAADAKAIGKRVDKGTGGVGRGALHEAGSASGLQIRRPSREPQSRKPQNRKSQSPNS